MSWWDDVGDWLSGSGGDSASSIADTGGSLLGDYDYGDLGALGSNALTSLAASGDSFGTDALSRDWGLGDWGELLGGEGSGALGQFASSLMSSDGPAPSNWEQYGPGISNTAAYAAHQGVGGNSSVGEQPGVFDKLLQGLGIQGKDGEVNYSDPKVMDKILRTVVAGGNIMSALGSSGKPRGYKSTSELRTELAGPFNQWTPAQAAQVRGYFDAPVRAYRNLAPVANGPSAVVPGKRFAEGGSSEAEPDDMSPTFHSTGALGALVGGPGGGQDDLVAARLGRGEYVFDADSVAALGDGSNERGAEVLDKWRAELRQHKRAAPAHKIPPRAKTPAAYLKQAKAG